MNEGNQALQKKEQERPALSVVGSGLDARNSLTRLNMRELKELATVFVESGAFPDLKTLAQAQVKIIAGAELGFSPIVSVTGIHFFMGKVELSSTLKASLIKDSGKYDYKILELTRERCEIAFFKKVGSEWVSCGVPVEYTIKDATDAKLTGKDNWKNHPKDMLFAACIRQGMRRYCPDVVRGLGSDQDDPEVETVDASAMEDAKAVNQVIDGELVDTSTGEVIEEAGEAAGAEVEAETVQDSLPMDKDESKLADLRAGAAEAYSGLTGASRTRANEWLGQATIGTLDATGLKRFLDEVPNF